VREALLKRNLTIQAARKPTVLPATLTRSSALALRTHWAFQQAPSEVLMPLDARKTGTLNVLMAQTEGPTLQEQG